MEFLAVIIVVVLFVLLILPFLALAKAAAAQDSVRQLTSRLARLERHAWPAEGKTEAATANAEAAPTEQRSVAAAPSAPYRAYVPLPRWETVIPMPDPPAPMAEPASESTRPFVPSSRPEVSGKEKLPEPETPAEPHSEPAPAIHSSTTFEEFMGAKLFAWIGGLALFFGIALFVKYSFEHDLISPAMRVAIGFAAGASLVAAGLMIRRKENAVTAQTLCATGVVVLYAVTYACRSYYHFPSFTLPVTFALMAITTAGAFLLAVRMNAQVIAVLGIAAGFLTPFLLSTGNDYPLPLFAYIAFLDAGLLSLAHRRNWKALPLLGAIGTILIEWVWTSAFFEPRAYYIGNRILIPMAVYTFFSALFFTASALSRRQEKGLRLSSISSLLLGLTTFATAFYFLGFPSIASRPLTLFTYLFLIDFGLIALTVLERKFCSIRPLIGIGAFIFLAAWTQSSLTPALLIPALVCYFLFALFHSAVPIILQRTEKISAPRWAHLFPALSIVLAFLHFQQFHTAALALWPFILCLDLLSLAIALVTASLLPVVAMIALTFLMFADSITWIDDSLSGLPTNLFFIGIFSLLFVLATALVAGRLSQRAPATPQLLGYPLEPANLAVQLPSLSAAMPFILIIQVMTQLPLHSPALLFTLAFFLVVMLLGIARLFSIGSLPFCALIAALMVEYTWHSIAPVAHSDANSLVWYLGFYAIFTIYPFLFRTKFSSAKAPWIASALAGPAHFYLIQQLAAFRYPGIQPGLLPAAFSVPALAGLWYIANNHPATNPARQTQLAIHGAVALAFITLIFPLQFSHEWITISWALEGAALCWFFRRVPHPGLRLAGIALLAVSFVRMGLNPAILTYYSRAAHPILNWYLYAFAIVSIALFAGARFLAPPRNLAAGFNAPPMLYAMGTLLLFILLNVEIADYFTAPGAPVLTFQFSANFARDMTYSITWALFALILLVIGIAQRSYPLRVASLSLLGFTMLKLFLHDLSQLDQLYRIAAFITVAIIAIVASFLYQRFIAIESAAVSHNS